jgi:hypothetical protein
MTDLADDPKYQIQIKHNNEMTNLANDPKYQMTYLNPQNGRF